MVYFLTTDGTDGRGLLKRSETLGDDRALVKNQPDDPPVIDVTEIAELESADDGTLEQPGRIWYEMNPKRWWQFWR